MGCGPTEHTVYKREKTDGPTQRASRRDAAPGANALYGHDVDDRLVKATALRDVLLGLLWGGVIVDDEDR